MAFLFFSFFFFNTHLRRSYNQDGGIGRHTAPPRTTRTDRKSNGKEVTKEIKNKHSPRPVGGAEMGSRGGEDSRCRGGTETGGVWDQRGRQSDHWQTLQPHIRTQINQEGQTQSGGERGRQSGG